MIDRLAARGVPAWRLKLARWIESPRVVAFIIGVILVNAVIRSLRVLRVLRLLTMIPSLRKVVAAFLHAIPGLGGVLAVLAIFFYTASVLATNLFGADFPQWFGTIGRSLFSLFQIMTLESWSMGIVRPVMAQCPYAWAFFVPFIILARARRAEKGTGRSPGPQRKRHPGAAPPERERTPLRERGRAGPLLPSEADAA